jgi:hypothetical protein
MTRAERTTNIEELISEHPGTVRLMINHNIPCLVCGEPVWSTVEESAREAGKTEEEIDMVIEELNRHIRETSR